MWHRLRSITYVFYFLFKIVVNTCEHCGNRYMLLLLFGMASMAVCASSVEAKDQCPTHVDGKARGQGEQHISDTYFCYCTILTKTSISCYPSFSHLPLTTTWSCIPIISTRMSAEDTSWWTAESGGIEIAVYKKNPGCFILTLAGQCIKAHTRSPSL